MANVPIAAVFSMINGVLSVNMDIIPLLGDWVTGLQQSFSLGSMPPRSNMKFPAIAWGTPSLNDISVFPQLIIDNNGSVNVWVITKEDEPELAAQIYSLVHDVLENLQGFGPGMNVTPYGTIVDCHRTSTRYYNELDHQNVKWQYLGGVYEVNIA